MKFLKPAITATALVFPFQAFSQTACEPYTVASGDTLRLIAERVYGARDLSPVIYNANRGVVGGNPNNIRIGMRLNIPCGSSETASQAVIRVVTGVTTVVVESTGLSDEASDTTEASVSAAGTPVSELPTIEAPVAEDVVDNSTSEPVEEAPVIAMVVVPPTPVLETAPAVAQVVPDIQFPDTPTFVSAGVFPPFSDGGGQGMMTNIVRAALGDNEYLGNVEVNPVSAPFDPLMASNDPDVVLSFPWINPGCENTEFLSERSTALCDNFQFSNKAFEIVMTFFVADQGGLAQATETQQFDGKNICVPEQYPISHLAEAGFVEPNVTIIRGKTVAECMGKLLSGQTDVVNADYLSVESTYAVLNSQSIIVENPSFTWIRSVHAVASNENQAGLQTLQAFNDGLSRIKESGEWAEVVQEFMN
ncbi:MAG: transporter substrate-binding domain-containing protein [Rhodobacteraceae bacterium]|nr:transporter substrate-binding domain-containing protein [Paracoccaceae bacterium]